jgi:hypothetical protein
MWHSHHKSGSVTCSAGVTCPFFFSLSTSVLYTSLHFHSPLHYLFFTNHMAFDKDNPTKKEKKTSRKAKAKDEVLLIPPQKHLCLENDTIRLNHVDIQATPNPHVRHAMIYHRRSIRRKGSILLHLGFMCLSMETG